MPHCRFFEPIHSQPCSVDETAKLQIGWASWRGAAPELAVRFKYPDRTGVARQTVTLPLYAHVQLHALVLSSGALAPKAT